MRVYAYSECRHESRKPCSHGIHQLWFLLRSTQYCIHVHPAQKMLPISSSPPLPPLLCFFPACLPFSHTISFFLFLPVSTRLHKHAHVICRASFKHTPLQAHVAYIAELWLALSHRPPCHDPPELFFADCGVHFKEHCIHVNTCEFRPSAKTGYAMMLWC